MPRKIAGSAIRTIDPSMVAMSTPSVVMNRATHRRRVFTPAADRSRSATVVAVTAVLSAWAFSPAGVADLRSGHRRASLCASGSRHRRGIA